MTLLLPKMDVHTDNPKSRVKLAGAEHSGVTRGGGQEQAQ